MEVAAVLDEGVEWAAAVTLGAVSASVQMPIRPQPIYAQRGHAKIQALRMVCRRLEVSRISMRRSSSQSWALQFPGRFTSGQYKTLLRRVNRWRQDARARGVVIGSKTYRRIRDKPRGRPPTSSRDHWQEMVQCLEAQPDHTALELLVDFRVRDPGTI